MFEIDSPRGNFRFVLELIAKLLKKVEELSAAFDLDKLRKEVEELDEKASSSEFWDDPKKAAEVQQIRSRNMDVISTFESLKSDLSDAEEFAPMAEEGDEEIQKEVNEKVTRAEKSIEALEFRRMLGGELDGSSAILQINSGAGGTEAQDWVQMLLRMFLRWAETKDYKTEIVDSLPGEEAGMKNVTVMIHGSYAYGYLRSEAGIHRLVRISPFDSNKRRHTSFASVMVLPQVDDDIDIEIRDEDLRVDTYRASGAGGQHVNKTDSAVRLTHMPTGIVVTCQNERSQHKNKAQAMKILKARMYERELEEREKERDKLAGEKKNINFGSQIRSYVLQPYQMIKDHRTDFEMGNVQAVLDGDLDDFIRAYLLQKGSS